MIFQQLFPAVHYIFCAALRTAAQKDAVSIGARADELQFKFLDVKEELQFFCFRRMSLSDNFVPMGRGAMGYP